jgi:multiple sugar transport system substrate-binding protein
MRYASRRVFLAGSISTALAVLAACSSASPASPTAPAAAAPASPTASSASATTVAPTPASAPATATSATQPVATAAPVSQAAVSIRYESWWPALWLNFIQSNLVSWGKDNNITLSVDDVTTDRNVKLLAEIAGGNPPDIWLVDSYTSAKLYDGNQALDLAPYVKQDNVDLQGQYGLMGVELWAGKVYAMPFTLSPHAWYYNKTMLKQAGAPDPRDDLKGDLAWDDLLTIAQKVTKTSGNQTTTWGMQLTYTDVDYQLGGFISSNGGKSHDYGTMAYTLTDPKTVEAIQFVYDLVHKYKVCAPIADVTQISQTVGTTPFVAEQVAMFEDSSGQLVQSLNTVKDKFAWDVFPIPRAKKGGTAGVPYVSGNPNTVMAKTKYPDASWQAVKYMAGPIIQGIIGTQKVVSPALLSVAGDTNTFLKPPPDHVAVFANDYKGPVTRRFYQINSLDCWTIIQKELDLIFLDQVPLESGLKEANDKANAGVKYTSKPTIQA